MALSTSKFAWHKTMTLTALDLSTDAMVMYLTDLQKCNINFNGTNVFVTGSNGEKLIGFSHSGTVDLDVSSGLYDYEVLENIFGSSVEIGTTTQEVYEVEKLTVTNYASGYGVGAYGIGLYNTANTNTTYTALGEVGTELKYVYKVNSDGSKGEELTQSSVATAGTFTYTPGTKGIILDYNPRNSAV